MCFDTMILTALVEANSTQMLMASMHDRARVPPRVAGELRGRANGNSDVLAIIPPPPGSPRTRHSFGETVTLTHEEAQSASDFQRAWNGRTAIEANPKKDRGEAEAVAVSLKRGWMLVSQDHHAVGPPERRRNFVVGLPELLMLFAAEGRCMPARAWEIYVRIAEPTPALVCQGWPCDGTTEQTFAECCSVLVDGSAAA